MRTILLFLVALSLFSSALGAVTNDSVGPPPPPFDQDFWTAHPQGGGRHVRNVRNACSRRYPHRYSVCHGQEYRAICGAHIVTGSCSRCRNSFDSTLVKVNEHDTRSGQEAICQDVH